MPQIDFLIMFVIVVSLIFVLILHYDTTLEILLPRVGEIKKFLIKKYL